MEKTIVIVPAHNEEDSIQNVISSLKRAKVDGVIFDFVIVTNGCTDKTIDKVRKSAVSFIDLPKANKGAAFIAGVNYAANKGAKYLVTIDADVCSFEPKKILELLSPLVNKSTINMTIALYGTTERLFTPIYSGIRALRMSALKPIIARNKGWIRAITRTPYSLEEVLNNKFGKSKTRQNEFVSTTFLMTRGIRDRAAITKQITKTINHLFARKKLASQKVITRKRLNSLRKK